MCGIVGVVDQDSQFRLSDETITQMRDQLVHRGPDDQGTYLADGAMLSTRRLSIIDIESGQQPIANEDNSLWLVFNGEIYNYVELRQELVNRGHHFQSQSDSEVIVHAYEEYGVDCLHHFNGMFAFAIWNRSTRELFVARDRLGIKPLYYWADKGRIAFASELKSLLRYQAVPRSLNLQALDLFLALEYVPAPLTILDGVKKLPAGHYLFFAAGAASVHRYWDVACASQPVGERASVERFHELLEDAVRLRLRSDVPVGVFLSGGIDSSSVLSYMHQLHGPGIKSFSIGFGEASYNELPYARSAAEMFATDHCEAVLEPDIGRMVERLVGQFDEPFGDFSIFPTFLVSKLAQEHVKVVLSGDGGDEIFGGYDTYVAQRWADTFYERLPALLRHTVLPRMLAQVPPQQAKKGLVNKVKRFVEGGTLPADLRHTRWMLFMDPADKAHLYQPVLKKQLGLTHTDDFIREQFVNTPFTNSLAQQQYVDVKTYLVENILTKVDRMSMATSLEVRVPLLDHRLVEFALNLPPRMKIRGRHTKYLMRTAMAERIPSEILAKPKQGFSIPLKHWLRNTLKPIMTDLLSEETVSRRGYFNAKAVLRWQQEHVRGQRNHSHRLWALMVFELWCRQMQLG